MGRRNACVMLLLGTLLVLLCATAGAFLRPPAPRTTAVRKQLGRVSMLTTHAAGSEVEGQQQHSQPSPQQHQQPQHHPYHHRQHWHLVLRNLPFKLCRPDFTFVLRAIVDLALSGSGLHTRRVKVLKRRPHGGAMGVVFVLLEHEWTGGTFVDGGLVDETAAALGRVEVMGRPLRAARWVRLGGGGGGGE